MELNKQLLREFFDYSKLYPYNFTTTEDGINSFEEYKEAQIDLKLSTPIITLEMLESWLTPGSAACDTLVVGVTHQVRYNGVDFSLDLLNRDSIKFDLTEEIEDLEDSIHDRIHEAVTTGEMCSLEGKYLKSIFCDKILEKYKFVQEISSFESST